MNDDLLTAIDTKDRPTRSAGPGTGSGAALRSLVTPGPVTDFDIDGLVGIRLLGARPDDRRAVERQFGPPCAPLKRTPDITISYVDQIPAKGMTRLLGAGEFAYTEDAFLVLRGRHKRAIRVALPMSTVGGRCDIVCEHGVGRVPLLVAIVNLTLMAKGALAVHASAFIADGRGFLAVGWSKGGKTEALLAALARGASYVGDEWVHLAPDATMSGIREPMRVWDWHLASDPELRARVPRSAQLRMGALRALARTGTDRLPASQRFADLAARHCYVDLPPEVAAASSTVMSGVPLDRVLLVTSTVEQRVTAATIPGAKVAARMVSSLAYERAPLLAAYDAYRFAFPDATNPWIDGAADLERDRMHRLLDGVQATEVCHPYPVDLRLLGDVIHELAGAGR